MFGLTQFNGTPEEQSAGTLRVSEKARWANSRKCDTAFAYKQTNETTRARNGWAAVDLRASVDISNLRCPELCDLTQSAISTTDYSTSTTSFNEKVC